MRREDLEKLLGGYATGTLTDAEQEALFTAALEDQHLFDALASEQALRDLLRDPASKASLLTVLDRKPARRWAWWPGAVAAALAGVAAVAVLAVRMNPRHAAPVEIAEVKPPELPPPPAPMGPLGVRPLPGNAPVARRAFVLPKQKTQPPEPFPEPPRVDMPKGVESAELRGVIGGVPAPPPQPKVSTGQNIEVTAVAPVMNTFTQSQAQAPLRDAAVLPAGARSLFYGVQQQRPVALARAKVAGGVAGQPQPPNAGVRYDILRKQPGGNYVEIEPADLKTGDTIELKFTTNSSGVLSINGGPPVAVSAMTPHTTAPLPPGQQEVRVTFTRQQQALPVTVQTVSEVQDRSTYVVNPVPGQSVSFTIKLQYK